MIAVEQATAAARFVRVVAGSTTIAALVGLVALSAFWSRYGSGAPTVLRSADDALTTAVLQQEANGRVCTEEPAPGRVVLFETRAGQVLVLTFAQAVRATIHHEGTIRLYCVTP